MNESILRNVLDLSQPPFQVSKDYINTIVQNLILQVKEQGLNPCAAYEALEFVAHIKDAFKDYNNKETIKLIREEIEKFGREYQSPTGAIFKLLSRPAYDYSNDPLWRSYKEKEEHYTRLRKSREDLLRKTPEPDVIKKRPPILDVDLETGEVFERVPPLKTHNDTFSCSFK